MFADADTDGLVFVAERALDTGDTQDRVFIDDSADGECRSRNQNADATNICPRLELKAMVVGAPGRRYCSFSLSPLESAAVACYV